MAFGQTSGPPATGAQLRELEDLLGAAGHSGFRDARGPMGFTQRQAGGKFTRDEADGFIEQLQAEAHDGDADGPGPDERASVALPKIAPRPVPERSTRAASNVPRTSTPPPASTDLSEVPTELLAAELQRRGWAVLEP